MSDTKEPSAAVGNKSLSYKFQRLRERLREAVRTGELSGKLPGERVLAAKFACNAKTLSKALTDLAAEGLLERSVGRGTFVKGHGSQEARTRWLLVLSPYDGDSELMVRALQPDGVDVEVVRGVPQRRPSYLAQFTGVVTFFRALPADLVRDLLVRGITVVAVDHEPDAYAVNSVLVDRAGGAVRAVHELVSYGHKRIAVLEREGMPEMTPAILAASKLISGVDIETYKCDELAEMARSSATAMVVKSVDWANRLRDLIEANGRRVPQNVSMMVVGMDDVDPLHFKPEAALDGYTVTIRELADAIKSCLTAAQGKRPTTLWLVPRRVQGGSLAAPAMVGVPAMMGEGGGMGVRA